LGVRVVTTTEAAKIRNAKIRTAKIRTAVIRTAVIRTAVIRTAVIRTANSVDIKRGVTKEKNKKESISMIKKKRRFRAISVSVTYRCTVGV
jgi:hypothetical protein